MGGSHLQAKKGALCRNGICQHLDLGPNPVSCQEGERQMSVVFCLAVPTKTSCCRKRNWPLRSLSYPSRQVSTYGPSSDVTCPKSDLDSIFQVFLPVPAPSIISPPTPSLFLSWTGSYELPDSSASTSQVLESFFLAGAIGSFVSLYSIQGL